jgi:hypothetical protein
MVDDDAAVLPSFIALIRFIVFFLRSVLAVAYALCLRTYIPSVGDIYLDVLSNETRMKHV